MGSAASATAALLLALITCLAWTARAYDFYVGGRDGWVLRPSESFSGWANRNRFQVNDHLVFKYKKGTDSVLVVDEDDYFSCNRSHPIRRMNSGSSWFTLDRSGPFFFISGAPGRCEKGQKLFVVVLAVRHKKPRSAPPLVPAPAPAQVSAPTPSHAGRPAPAAPTPAPSRVEVAPAPAATTPAASSPAPAPSVPVGNPALAPTSEAPGGAADGNDEENDDPDGARGPAAATSGSGAMRASFAALVGLALGAAAFLS